MKMSLTDELRELESLYKAGTLNDDEFAKAKVAVISQPKLMKELVLENESLRRELDELKQQLLPDAAALPSSVNRRQGRVAVGASAERSAHVRW